MNKKEFKKQMINWKEWNKFTAHLDELVRSKAPRKLFKGKGRIKCVYDYQ